MTTRRTFLAALAGAGMTLVGGVSIAAGKPTKPPKPTPSPTPTPTGGTVSPTPSATASASSSGSSSLPPQTGPITISTGGTYTINVLATNSNIDAVTIATTQPVIIQNSLIQHAGIGIWANGTGINIEVRNSTITAITPSTSNPEQHAINSYEPTRFVFEHNNVNYGHGVQISTASFGGYQTNPLKINYNNFTDIGKLSQPGYYQGAVHLDKVTAPDGQILWNRVVNHYGSSWGEDIIALANSKGTSGHPVEIAHCLVNGAYPVSGNGSGYTGGAFDIGDIAGGYASVHHCYAVNYTNNGFMQPTNSPGITFDSCMAVYDGICDNGSTTVSSVFGAGFAMANQYGTPSGTQCVVTNCRSGHRRWNGSAFENQHYVWENQGTQDGGGNTTLTASSANESAAIAEFEASVVSAGVTIGPV